MAQSLLKSRKLQLQIRGLLFLASADSEYTLQCRRRVARLAGPSVLSYVETLERYLRHEDLYRRVDILPLEN